MASARNRGLREASGAYIQFLDSDDVIRPAKLELQLNALGIPDGVALAYCDFRRCAHDNVTQLLKFDKFCKPRFQMGRAVEDIAARWETELSLPAHCFLFDARLFRDHAIRFEERLPNHEDWDCWMRVFMLNPRVVYVPGELAVYRQHPRAMSYNLKRMRCGFLTAIDIQLALCTDDSVLHDILRRKRAQMDAVYMKRVWLRRLRLAWWKSWVPWPVQRAFGRIFGTDG